MVQVNQKIQPPGDLKDQCFLTWCEQLVYHKESFDHDLFTRARQLIINQSELNRNLLTKLYPKSIEIVTILSELRVDTRTLVAGMMYSFVDALEISLLEIDEHCSHQVMQKIKGVIAMDGIRGLQTNQSVGNDSEQVENLRKMLLVMVDDVTVVLIKLAERLYALRIAKHWPEEKRLTIAQETRDVYAPLANRLGVGQIKWEMEDLAFRFLNQKSYLSIAKHLSEKRIVREIYVDQVIEQMNQSFYEIDIKAELTGRAKHIYSIWKKMQRKQVGFEEIYDVRAIRVLVPKIQDCYSVLGVVHGLWKHIPKEFDDYIATPKENGYRSLHTAVIGPNGKTLEIQIRTHNMHQESELGVAAHWKYKEENNTNSKGYEAKIAWLRQLIDWQDEMVDSAQLAQEFRNQVFDERVYVFTPQGKLIDLPAGSTALDFAYRVHSDIGHRCRGAKANGRIINLTQALKTGQKIEILTRKLAKPSRDWLSEQSGYIKSSKARHKVQQWFKHQDKEKNSLAGKNVFEKELKKNALQLTHYEALAKHFNYNTNEELFAAIGSGDKGIHQVMNAVRHFLPAQEVFSRETVLKRQPKIEKRSASSDILVEGVGNLLTRMGGCCKPIPGDEISGYITQNRGIMIHRSDCRYLLSSKEKAPQRILQVSWTKQVNQHYLIDLIIKAYDRKGLLGDITSLMAQEKVSVTSLNTQVNDKRLEVKIEMQIEMAHLTNVSKLIHLIEHLSNIISVNRTHN